MSRDQISFLVALAGVALLVVVSKATTRWIEGVRGQRYDSSFAILHFSFMALVLVLLPALATTFVSDYLTTHSTPEEGAHPGKASESRVVLFIIVGAIWGGWWLWCVALPRYSPLRLCTIGTNLVRDLYDLSPRAPTLQTTFTTLHQVNKCLELCRPDASSPQTGEPFLVISSHSADLTNQSPPTTMDDITATLAMLCAQLRWLEEGFEENKWDPAKGAPDAAPIRWALARDDAVGILIAAPLRTTLAQCVTRIAASATAILHSLGRDKGLSPDLTLPNAVRIVVASAEALRARWLPIRSALPLTKTSGVLNLWVTPDDMGSRIVPWVEEWIGRKSPSASEAFAATQVTMDVLINYASAYALAHHSPAISDEDLFRPSRAFAEAQKKDDSVARAMDFLCIGMRGWRQGYEQEGLMLGSEEPLVGCKGFVGCLPVVLAALTFKESLPLREVLDFMARYDHRVSWGVIKKDLDTILRPSPVAGGRKGNP